MFLEPFFVADVTGMDDEGCLFVIGIGTKVGYPTFVLSGVEDFSIGYLEEAMRFVFGYARIIGYESEVVAWG